MLSAAAKGLVALAVCLLAVAFTRRLSYDTLRVRGQVSLVNRSGTLIAGNSTSTLASVNISVAAFAWTRGAIEEPDTGGAPCIVARAAGRYVQAGPFAVLPADNGRFVCGSCGGTGTLQQSQRTECLADCVLMPGIATRDCPTLPGLVAAFAFNQTPSAVWAAGAEITASAPIAENRTACFSGTPALAFADAGCVVVGVTGCVFALRLFSDSKPTIIGNASLVVRMKDVYSIPFEGLWKCIE